MFIDVSHGAVKKYNQWLDKYNSAKDPIWPNRTQRLL